MTKCSSPSFKIQLNIFRESRKIIGIHLKQTLKRILPHLIIWSSQMRWFLKLNFRTWWRHWVSSTRMKSRDSMMSSKNTLWKPRKIKLFNGLRRWNHFCWANNSYKIKGRSNSELNSTRRLETTTIN